METLERAIGEKEMEGEEKRGGKGRWGVRMEFRGSLRHGVRGDSGDRCKGKKR